MSVLIVVGVGTLLTRGNPLPVSNTPKQPATTTTLPAIPRNTTPLQFFGMHVDYSRGPVWPSLPIGMGGFPAGAGWAYVELQPGIYNWSPINNYISAARSAGVTQFVYTFYETPQWAASKPDQACFNAALSGCAAVPANISYWDQFVNAVVMHYRGEIGYYEIWDAPNSNAYWSGNVSQLVSMAGSAYTIIKADDPNATVLSPGVTAAALGQYSPTCTPVTCWLSLYLLDGGSKYADAIAFDGYPCTGQECAPGTSCTGGLGCAGAALTGEVTSLQSILSARGIGGKPIIDTYGGWGQNSQAGSIEQQAAYISRWYILQDSAGVKGALWYEWSTNTSASAYGSNVSAPLVAQAYVQTYDWLYNSEISPPCTLSGGIWSCYVTFKNGTQGLVLWDNSSSGSVAYQPPYSYKEYQKLNGTYATINGIMELTYSPVMLMQ